MTMFLRSLLLGSGLSTSAAIWLSASGTPVWAAILVAWIGGGTLGLALAAIGATLWPETPARRSSFTATEEEFRLWDADLALEQIDADLGHESAAGEAAGQGIAPEAPPASPRDGLLRKTG